MFTPMPYVRGDHGSSGFEFRQLSSPFHSECPQGYTLNCVGQPFGPNFYQRGEAEMERTYMASVPRRK